MKNEHLICHAKMRDLPEFLHEQNTWFARNEVMTSNGEFYTELMTMICSGQTQLVSAQGHLSFILSNSSGSHVNTEIIKFNAEVTHITKNRLKDKKHKYSTDEISYKQHIILAALIWNKKIIWTTRPKLRQHPSHCMTHLASSLVCSYCCCAAHVG